METTPRLEEAFGEVMVLGAVGLVLVGGPAFSVVCVMRMFRISCACGGHMWCGSWYV